MRPGALENTSCQLEGLHIPFVPTPDSVVGLQFVPFCRLLESCFENSRCFREGLCAGMEQIGYESRRLGKHLGQLEGLHVPVVLGAKNTMTIRVLVKIILLVDSVPTED